MVPFVSPKTGLPLSEDKDRLLSSNGEIFPVINKIPRFVSSDNYAAAFGLEWKRHPKTQLDSFTGSNISKNRLEQALGFPVSELKGKDVLEAGCGAGRFTELLVEAGANVHSIDLSNAVEVNKENIGDRPNYAIAQASILELPYPKQSFDTVICLGVLQHTPVPENSIQALWQMVKPGGRLVFDHYALSLSLATKLAPLYRLYLRKLPPEKAKKITDRLVDFFFPIHWAVRNYYPLQMMLSRVSPCLVYFRSFPDLTKEQHKEWCRLDTFDSNTDFYKHLRSRRRIRKLLTSFGANNVVVGPGPIGLEARCTKPPGVQMNDQKSGKLLLLSNEFPPGPGGIGTQAYQLAKNLYLSGWSLQVVASQNHASAEEIRSFNDKIPVTVTPLKSSKILPFSFLRKLVKVQKILSENKPSYIISTGDYANLMIFLFRKWIKAKWLAIDHGHLPSGLEWKSKKWSLEEADAVVSVSEFTRDATEQRGIRFKRSVVIHNGADSSDFYEMDVRPSKKKVFELDESNFVLLTVGNLSPRKGQEVVIRALPYVLSEYPDVHYCMAGLPTLKNELADLARSLGVERNVHFLDVLDRTSLLEAYNACDLFVMTSRNLASEFEGFGIAVLEAALCGKPAVVSTNSGLSEAIEEGITGLTVEENSPEATAEAIKRLRRDDALLQKMGTAAKERAQNRFTWPKVVQKYQELLGSL